MDGTLQCIKPATSPTDSDLIIDTWRSTTRPRTAVFSGRTKRAKDGNIHICISYSPVFMPDESNGDIASEIPYKSWTDNLVLQVSSEKFVFQNSRDNSSDILALSDDWSIFRLFNGISRLHAIQQDGGKVVFLQTNDL
ncbi:hypothetical protein DACRYDRAFT_22486, partial [Dacryopinax primogenitus]